MKSPVSLLTTLLFFSIGSRAEASSKHENLEVVSSSYDEISSNVVVENAGRIKHPASIDVTTSKHRNLLSCSSSQQHVQITFRTDKFPSDTSWRLLTSSGKTIASSPSPNGSDAYKTSTEYTRKFCLDIGETYSLKVKDAWGDGLTQGEGYYKVVALGEDGDSTEITQGGSFKDEIVETFLINQRGGKSIPATSKPVLGPVPTPSNYAHQHSNSQPSFGDNTPTFEATGNNLEKFGGGSITKFTSRMGCSSGQRKAKFEIKLDAYGKETTWTLKDGKGKVHMKNNRTYKKNDYEAVEKCLPQNKYTLIIHDDAGDGICCSQGNGTYAFSLETDGKWEEMFRGGKFKSKKVIESVKIGSLFMNSRDKEWLVAHNTRRKKLHTEYGKSYVPLKWSEGLKEMSAKYAEELLSSCPSPTILHDPGTSYGENLAKNKGTNGWGDLKPADNVVNRFVEREMDDEWPHNAHLTQALWRATKYVGCAESVKPMGNGMCRIQVCRYARAGNCNVKKTVKNDWYKKMLADDSDCAPICPPEGCF